jgi:hypothetical protein
MDIAPFGALGDISNLGLMLSEAKQILATLLNCKMDPPWRAGRGVHPTHLTKPLRRVGAMAIDAGGRWCAARRRARWPRPQAVMRDRLATDRIRASGHQHPV